MATKFRRKSAKIAHITILCKKVKQAIFLIYGKVYRVGEFKYTT